MKLSKRSRVDPFIVMDVMEAARQAEAAGRKIIHMEVGQPGTPAPAGACNALSREMAQDSLGYTVALGLPALRHRIARHYGDRHDLDIDPERVVVTAGGSAAFVLGFTALFDRGDRIGLGEPTYPAYRQILKAMDLQPVGFQTRLENRFQPQPGDVPDGLNGLVITSPGNPSGTMLSHMAMQELVHHCQAQGISLISDEAYHGIEYDTKATSALEISDDVYVVNSFSKYYSMTGWRVGWMVVPPDHVRTIEQLSQNMFICPSHAGQVAALAAMDCIEELEGNLAVYRENRRLMMDGLPKAGFTQIAPPDGAFYIYADISDLSHDSRAFAAEILEQAGVAVTPGLDFDPVRGGQTLRFSYARSTADIQEGLARLSRFMSERHTTSQPRRAAL